MSALEFEVLTLFPEAIAAYCQTGLLGKAVEDGLVHVHCTNFRDFATDRHRTVDDAPFGGGAGMVMKIEPVVAAIESVEEARGPAHKILLTPSAPRFDQRVAERLAGLPRIALLCGRYEGIDDRVREHFVDECLSVGDYVLNGGEVAALAIIEAVSRLREGVLGNPESVAHESHARDEDGVLLEHPHYTRPASFRGLDVPAVLLSGDHGAITRWRGEQARARTWRMRPELRMVPRLSPTVPLYLALDAAQSPAPDDVWVTLARGHRLAGIVGLGPDAAQWAARWAAALGGRVPVTGLSNLAALRKRLRRSHRGPVAVFAHENGGEDGAEVLPAPALLDRFRGAGEGRSPAAVVAWVGPGQPPGCDAVFALPGALPEDGVPAALALPAPMIDIPPPWSAGAAGLADAALAHLRALWTGNESSS